MQRSSKPRASDGPPRRRQDPVSCRLCRVKKLKCNRQFPCSNCVTRGATCEFEPGQLGSASVATITRDSVHGEEQPSNATILAKLQRLEDLLLRNGHASSPGTTDSAGLINHTPFESVRRPTSTDQNGTTAEHSPFTEAEELQQREIQTLTEFGRLDKSLFPGLSHGISFEIMPLQHIFSDNAISFNVDTSPFARSPKRIFIPLLSEARFMFQKYAESVCYYHHIVHLPTLKASIETIYSRLERNEPVEPSHVTLMIVVFATVLWYLSWNDADSTFMPSRKDKERIFVLWFKSALDVLDHTRRTIGATLEDLQALIILVFLDYNVEGFTARSRSNLGFAVHIARDLGLHRLDAPNNDNPDTQLSKEELIQKEIRRRVFWHLASTEWMISLAGGPSEGMYYINPNHTRVNLPKNINDHEFDVPSMNISPPLTLPDHPLSIPTAMSYSLQRIRTAEVSRQMIDLTQSGIRDLKSINYEDIKSIDARLASIVNELPYFFRLDEESVEQTEPLLKEYPQFAMHRYLVNVSVNTMRCKLHQPYLVRGAHDKAYSFSTEMCLSTAMRILQINKMIKNEESPYIPQQFRMVGLTHHLYLATVVLVMDLCFNGPNEKGKEPHKSGFPHAVQNEEVSGQQTRPLEMSSLVERYEEVLNAIGMLENARNHSASTSKFLDTLMDVLQKYKVKLCDGSDTQRTDNVGASNDDAAEALVSMSNALQNSDNRMEFNSTSQREGSATALRPTYAHYQDNISPPTPGNVRRMWPSAGAIFQGPTSNFSSTPFAPEHSQSTQNNLLSTPGMSTMGSMQPHAEMAGQFQPVNVTTATASALDEVWNALSLQQQQQQTGDIGFGTNVAGGPLEGVAMPDWDQLFSELDGYIA